MANYAADMDLRKTARLAGFLYLILALSGFCIFAYVQPKLLAGTDAAATANSMLANEFLFRMSKAAGVVTNILFVIIVLLLYRLLKQVNEHQAKLMVALVIIFIPVAFTGDALEMTALNIFKGNILQSFPTEQAQDIGMTIIKISQYSAQMLTVYWGLWLMPLGWLVYKSGFIPRIFGILLIVNGLGYIIHCFTFILFPELLKTVLKFIYPTYFTGEIPFILWLLIKGVSVQKNTS
ncbi:MAG: hypothetical protein EPGJADBJ_04111 [Saprospiraceae bacterium]|nr:hypothetical protein [Saprospiraceae bacterium]